MGVSATQQSCIAERHESRRRHFCALSVALWHVLGLHCSRALNNVGFRGSVMTTERREFLCPVHA